MVRYIFFFCLLGKKFAFAATSVFSYSVVPHHPHIIIEWGEEERRRNTSPKTSIHYHKVAINLKKNEEFTPSIHSNQFILLRGVQQHFLIPEQYKHCWRKNIIIIIIIIINITHLRLYYICVVLWFKPELSRIIRSVLLLC